LNIQIIQERRNNHLINYFSSSLEHALSNPVDLLKPTSHHDSHSTFQPLSCCRLMDG
ncbi:hypothetical protein P692DRAFT_20914431, partial [Suillus brevipes Sb2]